MADRLGHSASVTASRPLRVLLVCDRARLSRWQLWLAEALAGDGRHDVRLAFTPEPDPLPSAIRLLVMLEGLLFPTPKPRASDVLDEAEVNALSVESDDGEPYDLAVDFTARERALDAARVIRPVFDGVAGEGGVIDALLDRRLPRLGLNGNDGVRHIGVCALEDPAVFTRGLDSTFSRMGGLLLAAVRAHGRQVNGTKPKVASAVETTPETPGFAAPAIFLVSGLAAKARARLTELLGQAPNWSIAWRRGVSSAATLDICYQDFTRLQDDGRRFFADPFVLMRGDLAHVFCEEVPFATGRGLISHFTIDDRGNVSGPRPVLEQPYHLSYPFVFERDGEVWMIPESSAARTVELYRAERFPDRWTKQAILLDDVLADDSTLFETDGRLFLFAALRDWQASSCDALGLYRANSLTGPWHAHPANPVLLDPSAARPAGALFAHGRGIVRPAQDCSRGYGRSLAFCRIDRLDDEGFSQTVVARLASHGPVRGPHTYNRAGDVEVIDLLRTS